MTSPGSASARPPRVAAAAVPGCQHVLGAGAPCQDAAAARVSGERVCLAVSDGHGSAEYRFADEGARIAVRVALDALDALLDRLTDAPNRHDPEALEIEHGPALSRRIAWEWNRRVKAHARMVATLDSGTAAAPPESGEWAEVVRPYGATLIAAAFEPDLAIWLRLGDGDLLAVDDTGARRIFGVTEKIGQGTYSLCMREWVDHVRVRFERPSARLAVLATDGVVDPYASDPSFEEEWGTRILDRIGRAGWVDTVLELPRWLGTLARDGDDCSVAVAWFPPPRAED